MLTLDRNLLHRFGLLLVILIVGLALSLLTDTFLSVANFTNVARQISINGTHKVIEGKAEKAAA